MNFVPSPGRRVSRIQAFSDQGVALAYPLGSWSGVRDYSGGVVFAMQERDVQSCLDGFRCLLWSPPRENLATHIDRPIALERLGHCRLAVAFGGADGLLVRGPGAEVERGNVLPLRVEQRGAEYWAFWGTVAVTARRDYADRDGATCEAELLAA